jgi:transposase
MHGILNGLSPDKILSVIHARVRVRKEAELRELLDQALSPSALMQLDSCLHIMKAFDEVIKRVTQQIHNYAVEHYPREYHILRTVPGIGDISAITLIAEIGDFKDFNSGDKLASWLGLVPKVYQSANHTIKRSITKRGSRLGRWIMNQVAHAATRSKKNVLRDWYETKKAAIGTGKVIIGLARKMITIIWHLIVNDKEYVDKYSESQKAPAKKELKSSTPIQHHNTLEGVIALLSDAHSTIRQRDPDPI